MDKNVIIIFSEYSNPKKRKITCSLLHFRSKLTHCTHQLFIHYRNTSNRMRSGENPSLCWLISAYHYFSENKPARLVANIRSAIFLRLRNFSILYGLHIKTFRRYHAWYYSCTFAICIIIITRIYVYVTWFAHISRRFNGSPLRIAYYW